MTEKITVQYLNDSVPRLKMTEGKKGDWVDLYSAAPLTLKKGEHGYIHLGVAMKLPEGYEAHLAPRSSTFKNWKILQTNSVGVIDNSYSGPNDWWKMSVYATEDVTIEAGQRVCQFRIIKRQPELEFVEGSMTDADRGGFGSTGTN